MIAAKTYSNVFCKLVFEFKGESMIVIKTFEINSSNCDKDILEIAEEIENGYTVLNIERIGSMKAFWPYVDPDIKITLGNKAAIIKNES